LDIFSRGLMNERIFSLVKKKCCFKKRVSNTYFVRLDFCKQPLQGPK
jgi:hypothetical protein